MGRLRSVVTLAATIVALAAGNAMAHGGGPPGTFGEIGAVLEGCTAGCHEPGGQNSMWFNSDGGGHIDWNEAYVALVGSGQGALPSNTDALLLLKRRVDPRRPWNSYLLDKLMGKLKNGEGTPMPRYTQGLFASDPKMVKKIETWILGGAPIEGYVEGDPCYIGPNDRNLPAYFGCSTDFELDQPATPALAAPAQGLQLAVAAWSFTYDHAGSPEQEKCFLARAGNLAGYATKIEGVASAGTSYLLVSRSPDTTTPAGPIPCPATDPEAPFLVLRSRPADPANSTRDPGTGKFPNRTWVPQPGSEILDLPSGTGLEIAANQAFLIRHRVRAEFVVKPTSSWMHGATGEAKINLHTESGAPAQALVPLYEATIGGLTSFVPPPRGAGVSTNVWAPLTQARLVAVSVLADKHVRPDRGQPAVEVSRITAAGAEGIYSSNLGDRAGYAMVDVTLEVAEPVVARCIHDNGDQRPLRYGCIDRVSLPSVNPIPVPGGTPLAPAPWCDEDGAALEGKDDCPGAGRACGWANLVAGPGENDARCTLIGLYAVP